jgi:hypothetical protein
MQSWRPLVLSVVLAVFILLPSIASATTYRKITQSYLPAPIFMRYTNNTDDPISYAMDNNPTWIYIQPYSGTVNPGQYVDFKVSFTSWLGTFLFYEAGWPPSVTETFDWTFSIIDTSTGNPLDGLVDQTTGEILDGTVHVSFVPPNITVSPASIEVEVIEGQLTVPTGATLTITHTEDNIGCYSESESYYCFLRVEFWPSPSIITNLSKYDLQYYSQRRGVHRGESVEMPVYAYTINHSPGTYNEELYINSGDTRVIVPVTVRGSRIRMH